MSGAKRAPRRPYPLRLLPSLAGCCAMLPLPPAAADAEPRRLAPVEVSAYRLPVLLDSLSYSVALIDRETQRDVQALTVADALRAVPGVHIDRLGGPGGGSNVYLRGADPNHTLVMIDGVPINDPNDVRGGSVDLGVILAHDVARIEVLRGAHSAAFGADAMGGAINIVTVRGEGSRQAFGRVSVGGQGLRAASATVAGGGFAIGGGALRDGEREDGGRLEVDSASASLTLPATPAWSTRISARVTDRRGEAFPESSGGVQLAVLRELERRDAEQLVLAVDSRFTPTGGPRWNLRLARLERSEHTASPGVAPGAGGALPASESDSRLTRDLAGLTAAFDDLPLGGVATVGVQFMREEGRAATAIPAFGPDPSQYELSRITRSWFGELRLEPVERLRLVASARRDVASSVDGVTSRSLGSRWTSASGATVLRANWSEGFKPPSFFALANPLVGNPGLRPETSRTLEGGIDRRVGESVMLRASLFRHRYEDLIDFDAATFRLVNRRRVTSRGAELGLQWLPADGLSLDLSYTAIAFDSGGEPLRNRPERRASVSATMRIDEAWSIHGALVHVGRTRDFSVPTGDTVLGSYRRVDLGARYRTGPRLVIEAAVDNMLDKRYESFVGFRAPGRRLRVALSMQI